MNVKVYEQRPLGNIKNIESAEGYQKTLPSQHVKLKQDALTSIPATFTKHQNNGLSNLKKTRNIRYAVNKANFLHADCDCYEPAGYHISGR